MAFLDGSVRRACISWSQIVSLSPTLGGEITKREMDMRGEGRGGEGEWEGGTEEGRKGEGNGKGKQKGREEKR